MHFLLAVNKQFGQVRTVSFPKDSWEGALHMEPSPSLCRSSFVGPALNNPRFPAVSGCPGTRDPQPLSQPVLFLTWRNMSGDPSPRLDLSAHSEWVSASQEPGTPVGRMECVSVSPLPEEHSDTPAARRKQNHTFHCAGYWRLNLQANLAAIISSHLRRLKYLTGSASDTLKFCYLLHVYLPF